MDTIFWSEFAILFAAALAGSFAILPYSVRLIKGSGRPLKMPMQRLVLLSVLQNAVIFAVVVAVGLWAAHAIGLGAPDIEAAFSGLPGPSLAALVEIALPLGIASGALLLFADLLFLPYLPKPLVDTALSTTLWENFTASFYGGINEELLMRLCGLSVLAWLLSLVWHAAGGQPTAAGFWIVNIIMAILFGIGHLPALKGVVGSISRIMLVRTLLLNAPIGLVCGWLFWTYGIETAIIAHFSADIVYHVVGTLVLRRSAPRLSR